MDPENTSLQEEQEKEAESENGDEESIGQQGKIALLYDSDVFSTVTAVAIFLNFVVTACDKQIVSGDADLAFELLEYIFTSFFFGELVLNMAAHTLRQFWLDSWNVFDFVTVLVSLLSLLLAGVPGASILRVFRAFRIFRLFKRNQNLLRILLSIERAIPGCANGMGILLLVSSIYAILSVQLYKDVDPVHFSTFLGALFTLTQFLTFDNWSEIAWPIVNEYPASSLFFSSFIMLGGIVLINVIIANLLSGFADSKVSLEPTNSASPEEEKQERAAELQAQQAKLQAELDAARELLRIAQACPYTKVVEEIRAARADLIAGFEELGDFMEHIGDRRPPSSYEETRTWTEDSANGELSERFLIKGDFSDYPDEDQDSSSSLDLEALKEEVDYHDRNEVQPSRGNLGTRRDTLMRQLVPGGETQSSETDAPARWTSVWTLASDENTW
ncbi:hypothetical protein CYMTET_53828 [Cymbomonas tetramitiformis]|uniref:Ion transport domain-containing protein n=1 Tax=Cymbomonas tetramitiformis TaxID=36881 RepID=A0AAE0BGA2_9CHLO|nr:hypothetical protein CYMTET_53828 [Cymbomonas tetramitiformis]|eukprot:gene11934-14094_t